MLLLRTVEQRNSIKKNILFLRVLFTNNGGWKTRNYDFLMAVMLAWTLLSTDIHREQKEYLYMILYYIFSNDL